MGKKLTFEIDNLNRRILNELQQNSRVSTAEIGRRVGLSAPAVSERILRMEEEGLIKGYKTVLDYDILGFPVRVFITFRSKAKRKEDAIRIVDTRSEIIEWHVITGDSCMLLKVAVRSTKELESLIEYLQENGETSTSIILSESRHGFRIGNTMENKT
jgi:Lrp/AsnC family transcriptional regulator, leucine-responsive regulatory protein